MRSARKCRSLLNRAWRWAALLARSGVTLGVTVRATRYRTPAFCGWAMLWQTSLCRWRGTTPRFMRACSSPGRRGGVTTIPGLSGTDGTARPTLSPTNCTGPRCSAAQRARTKTFWAFVARYLNYSPNWKKKRKSGLTKACSPTGARP